MEKEIFVQNVKCLCLKKGVKPTNACKESGVGGSFLSDINRGRVPSVSSVQILAEYLGVTTSELLGEEKAPSPATDESEERLLILYRRLNQEGRDKLLDYADDLSESGKYKKVSAFHVGTKEV